jgi:hypothetical protein
MLCRSVYVERRFGRAYFHLHGQTVHKEAYKTFAIIYQLTRRFIAGDLYFPQKLYEAHSVTRHTLQTTNF